MTESFEQRHAILIREFNEYLFDHPEFTEAIPAGAIVVIQVADNPEYNAWSRALAEANREPGRPLVYCALRNLGGPCHSNAQSEGESERGGGPPLSVGPAGRAGRLRSRLASARAFPANEALRPHGQPNFRNAWYVHVDALAPQRSRLINPQLRLAS